MPTVLMELLPPTLCQSMFSPGKTLVFGHRGASHDAPENTLAAFREAFRQGADGIEGDFHLTSDSQIVCIHDADTLRTGGQLLVVARSRLGALRELEYGGWKDAMFCGEPLPSLADLIPLIPEGRWLVIELKTGPEIVVPLVETLQACPSVLERTLIIAFDELVIASFKHRMPGVLAHWLTDYQWDPDSHSWVPSVDTIIQTIRRCKADGLGSENRPEIVTAEFVARLQSAGIEQFHIWTVDLPQEAVYYRGLGAFAVTSTCPGWIVEAFGRD